MILLLLKSLEPSDVYILVGLIVFVCGLVMAWWEFYGRPLRDSLDTIARCLNVARQREPETVSTRSVKCIADVVND